MISVVNIKVCAGYILMIRCATFLSILQAGRKFNGVLGMHMGVRTCNKIGWYQSFCIHGKGCFSCCICSVISCTLLFSRQKPIAHIRFLLNTPDSWLTVSKQSTLCIHHVVLFVSTFLTHSWLWKNSKYPNSGYNTERFYGARVTKLDRSYFCLSISHSRLVEER